MGAEHSFAGRDAANDVISVRHNPNGSSTNCHAVTVQQAATSGTGSALNAESRNADAPAAVIKGPGDLLDLRNASGVSKFNVSQGGTVTAAGVALGAAAFLSLGATTDIAAPGSQATALITGGWGAQWYGLS